MTAPRICNNCHRDGAWMDTARFCDNCHGTYCQLCGLTFSAPLGDDEVKGWECWGCQGMPQAASHQRGMARSERGAVREH